MRQFFFGVVKFVSYEKGVSINCLLLWRHGGLMISEVDSVEVLNVITVLNVIKS